MYGNGDDPALGDLDSYTPPSSLTPNSYDVFGATPPPPPATDQTGAGGQIGTGGALSPQQAWGFILPHEGGFAAHDANGAAVNFGINQAANPDVDVSKLTPSSAEQRFIQKYWGPSGAANLPGPLAAIHADTYYINPAKAMQLLQRSGGDPNAYMAMREQWLDTLAQSPKYARFAHAWNTRNADLAAFAGHLSGGPVGPTAPAATGPSAQDAPPPQQRWGSDADLPVGTERWGSDDDTPVGALPAAQPPHGFSGTGQMRLAGAVLSGIEDAGANALKYIGRGIDAVAAAAAAQSNNTPTISMEPPPPMAPVVAPVTEHAAAAIQRHAKTLMPEQPNVVERVAHGVGEFVPGVAAMAVNPAAGVAVFGSQGYQAAYDDARARGSSDDHAHIAGLENMGVQGVLGAVPIGKAAEAVAAPIARALPGAAGSAVRVGAHAAAAGVLGGTMQVGSNVVARENYDPNRPVMQDVPEAAGEMALAGAGVHAIHEATGGGRPEAATRVHGAEPPLSSPMPATDWRRHYEGDETPAFTVGPDGFASQAGAEVRFTSHRDAASFLVANKLGGEYDIAVLPDGGLGLKYRAPATGATPKSSPSQEPSHESANAAEAEVSARLNPDELESVNTRIGAGAAPEQSARGSAAAPAGEQAHGPEGPQPTGGGVEAPATGGEGPGAGAGAAPSELTVPEYVDRYIAGDYRGGAPAGVQQFAVNHADAIEAEFLKRSAAQSAARPGEGMQHDLYGAEPVSDQHLTARQMLPDVLREAYAEHPGLDLVAAHAELERGLADLNADHGSLRELVNYVDPDITGYELLWEIERNPLILDALGHRLNVPDVPMKPDIPAAQEAASASVSTAPSRDEIADRYAQLLDRPRSEYHEQFADAVLSHDARSLQYLANGLNDKGKQAFSEATGIKLPRGQADTWRALREWGGISDADEAAFEAQRSARRNIEKAKRDLAHARSEAARIKVRDADGNETDGASWVEKRIDEGYTRLVNTSGGKVPKYALANTAGQGFAIKGELLKYARAVLADRETVPGAAEVAAAHAETAGKPVDRGFTMIIDPAAGTVKTVPHQATNPPAERLNEAPETGMETGHAEPATPSRTGIDDRNGDAGDRAGDVPGIAGAGEVAAGLEGSSPTGSGELRHGDGGGELADALGEHPPSGSGEPTDTGAQPGGEDRDSAGRRVSAGTKPAGPSGSLDYHAPPGSLARTGGWRATAERNLDILELVNRLDAEGRPATPEEQALLAKFTGWGAGEIRNNMLRNTFRNEAGEREISPYSYGEWKPTIERAARLLKGEQLETALQSTQYAHYTSEAVIRSIWQGLDRLGFKGGRMVEPGMGIGLFAVAAPPEMLDRSHYTGIELDKFTAKIAGYLLPQENTIAADFTRVKLPDGFFDVAIGNPPFANIKVTDDPAYRKLRLSLHDYFFAKSIDKVRPGGLMVFVTSRYTMDKLKDQGRQYLADRADLLGAIRLPQTAFKDNAGTEVVTDVLFFQKRFEGVERGGEPWLGVAKVKAGDGDVLVNEYFAAHPEMVLGEHATTGSMYRKNEYTVTPREGDIAEQFASAVQRLPQDVYLPAVQKGREAAEAKAFERDMRPAAEKEGGLYVKDGQVYIREQGVGRRAVEIDRSLTPANEAWLKDYAGLRDALKQAQRDQLDEGDWQASLTKLNRLHDAFVKKHGPISAFTAIERKDVDEDGNETVRVYRRLKNDKLLRLDIESPLVQTLEHVSDDGVISKGPFLKGRTLNKPARPVIESPQDALMVSLDEIGRLDVDYIASMLKVPRNEVISALGDAIYMAPGGEWQTADEYLSGDVVTKLEEARAAADADPRFRRNLEALTAAQPKPLGAGDINVKLGAGWIPERTVQDFMHEVLGLGTPIAYEPATAEWAMPGRGIRSGRTATAEYGTDDQSPSEILLSVLNNRTIKVTRKDSDGKSYVDPAATAAANEKAKQLSDRFKAWAWEDGPRAAELAEIYNRKFNNLAPRRFDGSHLTTPGLSSSYTLYPHQKRAVWRIIQTGNTYLNHAVGAGKTLEMIVAGMESKRLGLIKKPMYVVPNHMLNQFSREFLEAYPAGNIMVADEKAFHTDNRKRFMAQAALNDPDAIIITHSAFGKIGTKPESRAAIVDQMIQELEAAMEGAEERYTRSKIEKQIEAIKRKFEGKAGTEGKDQALTFEDMGVDHLFLDEAHEFRKLDFVTNRAVKGIDPNGSQRALDLYIKTRWLERQNPGRSLVMASGTPVTNTMAELYTVMRYMDEAGLERDGLRAFDAWANTFGEVAAGYEQNAAGGYEIVERFAKFVNVPELMKRVRSFMDVLTSDELGDLVKRPTITGGQPKSVVTPPVPELQAYMDGVLKRRIAASRAWKPSQAEPANPDPIIAINTDARMSSIDMRFVDPKLPNDPGSKLNVMIDKIIDAHKAIRGIAYTDPKTGKAEPVKGGTQIVFSLVGFGEQAQKNRGFDLRAFVDKRLVEGGFKKGEIAWMGDANTHAKKEQLFKDMRSGKVRVLFGSPKNMGTGVNVQNRLKVLHYLSPPWYPSDVEQPHGRIVRQGNWNPDVDIYWYATKGTYDSTAWNMVSRKAQFIEQAMKGDDRIRSLDDISEANQYEMAAALAAGDERVIKVAGLSADIERLNRLQSAHATEQHSLASLKRGIERHELPDIEGRIAALQTAAASRDPTAKFALTVGNRAFDKQGEAGEALHKVIAAEFAKWRESPANARTIEVGRYQGHPLVMAHSERTSGAAFDLFVRVGGYDFPVASRVTEPGEVSTSGLGARIANAVSRIGSDLRHEEGRRDEKRGELAKIARKLGTPFPQAGELGEKVAEKARLQSEMAAETAAAEAAAKAPKESRPDRDALATPASQADLEARLRQVVPSGKVALQIVDSLGGPAGRFHRGVITIAMDGPSAMGALNHEVIHALRGAFTPEEWSALVRRARADRALTASIARRYPDLTPLERTEEAVADLFAHWATNPPAGLLNRAWARLKAIFEAIGNWLRGRGFASAEGAMRAVERGDVGARAFSADGNGPRYKIDEDRDWTEAPKRAGLITRLLGKGVDSVGAKLRDAAEKALPDPAQDILHEIHAGTNPMATGSPRAQATAKDFANAQRLAAWQWGKVIEWMGKEFDAESLRRMWEAADEHGVLLRRGVTPGPYQGLNRLSAKERDVVTELQGRADQSFARAQDLGMVQGDGLESYVPRMVVQMTAGGPKVVSRAGKGQAKRGANLSTTTGQLRQRKHETVEETEAAARAVFGDGAEVVRDIRTLALATQRLDQAIAGRTLVEKIKAMSKDAGGGELVSEGGMPDPGAYFTIPGHPALQKWGPKFVSVDGKVVAATDQNGDVMFEAHPIWISREFEGPLKAVLSEPSGGLIRALMDLKGKMMSLIMYSPIMHNAVIWGKAIPADPLGVLSLTAYVRGNAARKDPSLMTEAIRAGMDPIGHRYFRQDIVGIAAAEGQDLTPGRSWTAQVLGAVPGLFDKDAGIAVKRAVDKLGDVWHNTFLWDRIADLQAGLYMHIRDDLVKKGVDPLTAQRTAAHFANRYAGALPMEAMSKAVRNTANLVLFSRSFTLGNLAAFKDITVGLPSDTRAQIARDGGTEALDGIQGFARRKAIGMLVIDIALQHAGLMLAAGLLAWLLDQKYQAPSHNEPGKEDRFLIRYDPDGTAVYGRLPTGKVAEDLTDWATEPREETLKKLSPYGRLAYELASNDKGFGHKLYDPYDTGPKGLARNVGRIVWAAAGDIAPIGQVDAAGQMLRGKGGSTAAMQAFLPMAGITVSKGAPGGPAMADIYHVKDEQQFRFDEARPEIRDKIKAGDIPGARREMTELGVDPKLQNWVVRSTLNPSLRMSPRQVRDFMRAASPEDRARFQADIEAEQQRRASE